MSEPRYRRQILVEGIGEAGQAALRSARVAGVGSGALGCAILDQLARAGVGTLRIVDPDVPELSNLQRQILIDEDDVAARRPKALAAADKLARANSEVILDPRVERLEPGNAAALLSGVDLVLDGTDNFAARYLINSTCLASGTPWVYGGVLAAGGMSFPVLPGGPCLRCALGEEPPEGALPGTAERGVLCAVVQTVASLEVVRAFRILTGAPPEPRLAIVDLWAETFRTVAVDRDPACPVCRG
jgi:molybdopterin/thiamine biosynthesis adenylyltransferase